MNSFIPDQCVYKQKIYNQGETWNDGCDYTCECMDATTGFYECKPQYVILSFCKVKTIHIQDSAETSILKIQFYFCENSIHCYSQGGSFANL